MANNKDAGKLIVGIGSALVDILAHAEDHHVEKCGAAKGGMCLVEHDHIHNAMGHLPNGHQVVPGGSACNTVIGVGRLGGKARFVGKLGEDEFGSLFHESLLRHNVEPTLFKSRKLPTGRVLSIITPDAQRSMLTYLGASSRTRPDEIHGGCFEEAAIVHVEGYLIFNRDLIQKALDRAKEAGAKISLDLASFTVVNESRDFLMGLVRDYVDILIANEDEAHAFTGHKDEEKALEKLAEGVDIGVLKVGPKGSYVSSNGKTHKIEPLGDGTAVDTTGAGDLWASGFLYGVAHGWPLDKAGALGSALGYEVCQVVGASIPDDGWERIKKRMDEMMADVLSDSGEAK